MRKSFCSIAIVLMLSITLTAQSRPSAEGGGLTVWVGASISSFNPDYGCANNSPFLCFSHQLLGISPYADANHLLFHRVGAEGQARFLHWHGPALTEASYMAGPRVNLYRYKKAMLSAKFLVGEGHIQLGSGYQGSGNYFAYAPGAAVDFPLTSRVFGRVDYEYQRWPSFLGSSPGGHGGLTPNGFSVGLSYVILR
jgi:hypothetical protein